MTARLVSLDGHDDILLGRAVLLVGRHDHCDARIDSSRVSRRHCCLVLEGGRLVVRDLDSTNGTWVNGARVTIASMEPGDELAIGFARYRFEAGAEAVGTSTRASPGPPDRGQDEPPGLSTYEMVGSQPAGDARPNGDEPAKSVDPRRSGRLR